MIPVDPIAPAAAESDAVSVGELLFVLAEKWKTILGAGFIAGAAGAGIAFLMPPVYTARTTIMPPQQQTNATVSALSSLGALAGLGGGVKSPSEQYVALMDSATVKDRLIAQFKLLDVYGERYVMDARTRLDKHVAINSDKKSGLITIDVDDVDPNRSAALANAYVENLRCMTNNLAVTEAQQRRRFFEAKLKESQANLTRAQIDLQASGYNAGAIKSQPQAAAEAYARLQSEVATAEVRLQSMRTSLADTAPEVRQQQTTLNALRSQLASLEKSDNASDDHSTSGRGADYVTKLRAFKYEETLYDVFARQYESARVDESREGTLIQVVDTAMPPEHKSKPRRLMIALAAALAGLIAASFWVLVRSRLSSR